MTRWCKGRHVKTPRAWKRNLIWGRPPPQSVDVNHGNPTNHAGHGQPLTNVLHLSRSAFQPLSLWSFYTLHAWCLVQCEFLGFEPHPRDRKLPWVVGRWLWIFHNSPLTIPDSHLLCARCTTILWTKRPSGSSAHLAAASLESPSFRKLFLFAKSSAACGNWIVPIVAMAPTFHVNKTLPALNIMVHSTPVVFIISLIMKCKISQVLASSISESHQILSVVKSHRSHLPFLPQLLHLESWRYQTEVKSKVLAKVTDVDVTICHNDNDLYLVVLASSSLTLELPTDCIRAGVALSQRQKTDEDEGEDV